MTKLKTSTIDRLALMICGDEPYTHFPYRSSSNLTAFFRGIDLDYRHDGSTRKYWVTEVLEELNEKPEIEPGSPSSELKKVIKYLLDPIHFKTGQPLRTLDQTRAMEEVNIVLKSEGLVVEEDKANGEVSLLKVTGEFISTSIKAKETKKVVTFSLSIFNVPDKPVKSDMVSVMMPFKKEFDNVLKAIKAACSEVDMECYRVDDIWNNSVVIHDIFELSYCSSIVIADFSGKKPNVFYESGIAHTLGKNVIPITQNIDDVPFDLGHHRVFKYLNNNEGLQELKNILKKRLKVLK